MVRIAPFLGLGAFSLCPAQSSKVTQEQGSPPCWLCVCAACLHANEVNLVLMLHFGGWECSLTSIAVGAFKPQQAL